MNYNTTEKSEYDGIPSDEIENVDELNINYNNSKNYLFFGHQYRFQNYVIDSINSLLPKDKKIQKCSVLNNSILCLDVQPIKKFNLVKFQLSLVYDGDENSIKEGKTYCSKMMETSYSVDQEKFNNTFKISKNDNTQQLKLFFVRHGFSEHNDKEAKTGKKNTSLLPSGVYASGVSGKIFNEMYENIKIEAVFVSDLIRTQETASNFLSELSEFNKKTQIIVLPCLHESTELDGSKSSLGYFTQSNKGYGFENLTDCDIKNTPIIGNTSENNIPFQGDQYSRCYNITIKENPIPIDWRIYLNFYNDKMREPELMYNRNRDHCRNNHFLGMFFNYLDRDGVFILGNRIEEGGRRKRRQTKKQRVMKSKKVRRAKKLNKKSKKVKRRSNKRKA